MLVSLLVEGRPSSNYFPPGTVIVPETAAQDVEKTRYSSWVRETAANVPPNRWILRFSKLLLLPVSMASGGPHNQ
jgi:hypothetical protein